MGVCTTHSQHPVIISRTGTYSPSLVVIYSSTGVLLTGACCQFDERQQTTKRAVGARVEIGLFYFDSQSQIPMTCFLAFPPSPCLVLLPSSSRAVQYRPTLASGTKLTALQVSLDWSDRGVSQSVTTLQLFCNWEICLGLLKAPGEDSPPLFLEVVAAGACTDKESGSTLTTAVLL